jgi:hypothetical protein
MKRDRISEAEDLLRQAEATLRAVLLERLPEVADSGGGLFINSDFIPRGFPRSKVFGEGPALYSNAKSCVALRESLRVPVDGSVGALFIAACAENASESENRLGPRKLALSLLEHLKNAT